MPELLSAWGTVEARYPPGLREKGLRELILSEQRLGPFARALLQLWYTGVWPPMSAAWSLENGNHRDAEEGSLLAIGYPQGLVWRAAVGIHPQAVRPTGFGSWALAPEEG
ncbi:MAG TPA: hypothetical protein VMT37_02930 [Solirubrobacterales bacterium]|nr:hypothetical protein [Solirubrobacterales bacterium]